MGLNKPVNNTTLFRNCATLLKSNRTIFALQDFQKLKLPIMQTIIFDSNDDKFISQAVRFCDNIGKYTAMLGLDAEDVANLTCDVNIVIYLSAQYHSFLPSFITHNINATRNLLADVCSTCIGSKEYTRDIAIDLGLESATPENSDFAKPWFAEMPFAGPRV
jgi:hypothetical protein